MIGIVESNATNDLLLGFSNMADDALQNFGWLVRRQLDSIQALSDKKSMLAFYYNAKPPCGDVVQSECRVIDADVIRFNNIEPVESSIVSLS